MPRAEKKQREKRRDPILFGLIKNSRKLYFICDWKTDTDDLTLEKLEKELGVTRGSLVKGAETSAQIGQTLPADPAVDSSREARRRQLETYMTMRAQLDDRIEDMALSRASSRSFEWDGGRLTSDSDTRGPY